MNTYWSTFLLSLLFLISCAEQRQDGASVVFEEAQSNQADVHENNTAPLAPHERINGATSSTDMQVILVPSEFVIGSNRVAVGLLDTSSRMLHDATVQFLYYDLSDPFDPAFESEVEAYRISTPDGHTTMYAHEREFAQAGRWGVEIQALFPDGAAAVERIEIEISAETETLTVGEPAPAVQTLTSVDVDGDLNQLTSGITTNPAFYNLSLPEALNNNKPTLLLFATPGFCQTRVCGPVYDVASELEAQHGDDINFIHVEVYPDLPNPAETDWQVAPALEAFGLTTEPWVYLLDSDGTVAYRLEGFFSTSEIERQFQSLK